MNRKDAIASPRPEKKQRSGKESKLPLHEQRLQAYRTKRPQSQELKLIVVQYGGRHASQWRQLADRLTLMTNVYTKEMVQSNNVSLAQTYGRLGIEVYTLEEVVATLVQRELLDEQDSLRHFCLKYVLGNPTALRQLGYRGWLFELDAHLALHPGSLYLHNLKISRAHKPGPWTWHAYLTQRPLDAPTYLVISSSIVERLLDIYDAALQFFDEHKDKPDRHRLPNGISKAENDDNYRSVVTWMHTQLSEMRTTNNLQARAKMEDEYKAALGKASREIRAVLYSINTRDPDEKETRRCLDVLATHMKADVPFVVELRKLLTAEKFDVAEPKEPELEKMPHPWRAWLQAVRGQPAWRNRHWFIVPDPVPTDHMNAFRPSILEMITIWNVADTDQMTESEINALKQKKYSKNNPNEEDLVFHTNWTNKPLRYQHKIAKLWDFLGERLELLNATWMAGGSFPILSLLLQGLGPKAKLLYEEQERFEWRDKPWDEKLVQECQLTPDERLSYCNLQMFVATNEEEARDLGPGYVCSIIPQLVAAHPEVGFQNMLIALSTIPRPIAVDVKQLTQPYAQRQFNTESTHQSAHKKLPDQLKKHIFQYLAARYVNNPLMSSMITE